MQPVADGAGEMALGFPHARQPWAMAQGQARCARSGRRKRSRRRGGRGGGFCQWREAGQAEVSASPSSLPARGEMAAEKRSRVIRASMPASARRRGCGTSGSCAGQFGRCRWGWGRAGRRRRLGDGGVRLVTDAGGDGDFGGDDGAGEGFFVEGPEVFEGAAAANQKNKVNRRGGRGLRTEDRGLS